MKTTLISILIFILTFQVAYQNSNDQCVVDILTGSVVSDYEQGLFTSDFEGDLANTCDDHAIIGGYNKLGHENYLQFEYCHLPCHDAIRISFTLWKIDSWDGDEGVQFSVDGTVAGIYSSPYDANDGSHLCGNTSWVDKTIELDVQKSHSQCCIYLEWQAMFDDTTKINESFGISNLKITTINDSHREVCDCLFWLADNSYYWQAPDPTPGIGYYASNGGYCYGDDGYVYDGYVLINGYCWYYDEAQVCYDKLGNLDAEGYYYYEGTLYYGDILNCCRVVYDEYGAISYDILISYYDDEDPYYHYDYCFEQEINFIETDSYIKNIYDNYYYDYSVDERTRILVPPAQYDYYEDYYHDVWYWNPCSQQIMFTVYHDDLVPYWGCYYIEYGLYYEWICTVELNIYFSGVIQLTFEFQMHIQLNRTVHASNEITVFRNVVTGDCCENVLEVYSSLHYCENYTCTDYNGDDYLEQPSDYPNGIKEVYRREIFYVAHRIDTYEFQNYYLQPISLKIGPFIPYIHRWQQLYDFTITSSYYGTTNLLVYEVESYVALENLIIYSWALLDDLDYQSYYPNFDYDDFDNDYRRVLEETIGEDYKIMAENKMSALEPSNEKEQEKSKQNKNGSPLLSFAAILLLAILI